MSNPDLVPFDDADGQKLADTMEYDFPKSRPSRLADAYVIALNAAFRGKPRPPRTHAVTADEIRAIYPNTPTASIALKLQDLLQRRLTVEAFETVHFLPNVNVTRDRINAHFNLTLAPETADEKWARIRREGLSDEEATQIFRLYESNKNGKFVHNDMQAAFRKVFGIGEAGA